MKSGHIKGKIGRTARPIHLYWWKTILSSVNNKLLT